MQKGEMKRVASEQSKIPFPNAETGKLIEKARRIFREDFLGLEAIQGMEEKWKDAGIDIMFIASSKFSYTDFDLEREKQGKQNRRARLLVLRPSFMLVNKQKLPVTLNSLGDLFKKLGLIYLVTPNSLIAS